MSAQHSAVYEGRVTHSRRTPLEHAFSYPFQQTLLARGKFVRSIELDSSPVPFFSQPAVLTRALEGL